MYACSSNAGKLRDFALVASELGLTDIAVAPLPGLKDIAVPAETGETFEENARQKAIYYSQFTAELVLADDSGLEVDALGGAPGVHSARYAGMGATDEANVRLLLERMHDQTDRRARFVCVLAVARERRVLHVARGTVEGEILHAPRGSKGFGYDPLFFFPPFALGFGEADEARKFSVSHRGGALRKMIPWLEGLRNEAAMQGAG
jgi:XTP/dITP diphosphohydrolase